MLMEGEFGKKQTSNTLRNLQTWSQDWVPCDQNSWSMIAVHHLFYYFYYVQGGENAPTPLAVCVRTFY